MVSMAFTPFIIPTVAFWALFMFLGYLIPIEYELIVVGIVFCFTFAIPVLIIYLFRRIHSLVSYDPGDRKKHFMPCLLNIASYASCLLMMHLLDIPGYMIGIILVSLLLMIVFLFIKLKWNLSEHMGGAGEVIGALVSFRYFFGYNPVLWLCFFILLAGVLGSARIILGHHKLSEVLFGFAVGLICSLLVLHPMGDLFFYFI